MCSWERWTILQDLALAIVINTSAMLLSGVEFQPASWYSGTCAAFCTNVILQLILPVPIIGYAVTKKFANQSYQFIFSVFIENLIFVTLISLTMAYIQTSGEGMLQVWFSTYIQLVLIGYITSLVLFLWGSQRKRMGEDIQHI